MSLVFSLAVASIAMAADSPTPVPSPDKASNTTQCTSDSKTITVAINNYPSLNSSEIKDHKTYESKIGMNFMCSHVKIPVSKPKEGIKANFEEIKKYLSTQTSGITLVQDKLAFDKLDGAAMKKAVILSTLKCSCEGPNSVDYDGLTFKDGNKMEERTSTAYKPMSIGYDPNPNDSSDSNTNSPGTGNSSNNNQGSANPGKTATAKTQTLTPQKLDGNCVKIQDQLVCFIDEESKSLYRKGALTANLRIATSAIKNNIASAKDKRGIVDLLAVGSSTNVPKMYQETYPEYNEGPPQGFACIFEDVLCKRIARMALGSSASSNPKMIVLRATESSGSGWNEQDFKLLIDHEWSHIYDSVSTYRGSADTASSNTKYGFVNTYKEIKSVPIRTWSGYQSLFQSYPKCFSAAILAANGAGAPWMNELETFASTFEDFNNTNIRQKLNNLLVQYSSPSNCKTLLDRTIDGHKNFFSK